MIYPLLSFLVLQAALWCVVALGYFHVNGFYTDPLGLIFTAVFVLGHVPLFAWVLGLLCLPWRLAGPRATQLAAIIGGSIFSIWLAIDLFVFAQYRFHISWAMLALFFGPARSDIFVFSTGMWVLATAILLAILLLETGLGFLAKRLVLSKKIIWVILGCWLVCFVTYNGLYAWGQFMLIPSVISQRKALPLTYPLSANRQLRKWGFEPKREPYTLPSKGSLSYPKNPLTCSTVQNPLNILILLVDAWRADTFTPEIMPRLYAWSKQKNMTVFTAHLSGGNSTSSGVFSLFYALPHSYWDDFTGLRLPPLLISQALRAGYEPAIFASSKLNSPAFDRNIFSTITPLRIGSHPDVSWKRDVQAVQDFTHFLNTRQKDSPFFGFVFLDAPHGYSYPEEEKPFTPAKEINYVLLSNRTDPTPYFNQYKNSVYFIDKQLDQILSVLQQHRLLDNTVILITADHGQELNDSHQNFWGHNSNFTDYQTQVPLIVYFPGSTAPNRAEYRTTHYDIAPTLLQTVFQCSNPTADYSIGYHLFDPTPRPFVVFAGYEEKAIRIQNTILTFNRFNHLQRYGPHFEPVTQPPDPALVKEALQMFARFYK